MTAEHTLLSLAPEGSLYVAECRCGWSQQRTTSEAARDAHRRHVDLREHMPKVRAALEAGKGTHT